MAKFRPYSCLPSILLAIEGPWLCVLGAIYHTTAVIEPLTDFIFCADRPMDQGARIFTLARLFVSLSNAHSTLRNYYETLKSKIQDQSIPVNSSLFPYRVTFPSEGGVVAITYLQWLDEDKLVWIAETSQNESVIVKFTRHYCSNAHELLAKAGLAPILYYADEEESAENLRMIVMQNIEGAVHLDEVPRPHRPQVFDRIREALTLLHDNDFVFGDLRPPNILVTKDYQQVKIVDFDWCGKQGIARYPVGGVNREHAWPDGVETNGLIEKVHDEKWLQTLKS